ncbi:MAG: hypothetical protein ACFFDW_07710 [Candidatus Thorarchaeota archaeon]
MKKKAMLLLIQNGIIISLMMGFLNPFLVENSVALGELPVLLENRSFQYYSSTGTLLSWTGAGSKSTSYYIDGGISYYTSGSLNAYYYLKQTITTTDKLNAIKNEKITFSFWFKGHTERGEDGYYDYYESARAEIYYEYLVSGVKKTSTVSGTMVNPKSSNWYQCEVSASIPVSVTLIEVRIVGIDYRINGSFRTYIDAAKMVVSYGVYTVSSSTYGKMTCNYDIGSVQELSGTGTYDYTSEWTAAMAVIPASGYYVMSTKITISLLPILFHEGVWWNPFDNDYSYADQTSQIQITRLSQGNNIGYNSNPVALEELSNAGIRAVGACLDAIAGGVAAYNPVAFGALLACDMCGYNGEWLLHQYIDTDFNDPTALGYAADDYSAHEIWNYPTILPQYYVPAEDFVSKASAFVNFNYDMAFRSDYTYRLQITFEAVIGAPFFHQAVHSELNHWDLNQVYTFYGTVYKNLYITA